MLTAEKAAEAARSEEAERTTRTKGSPMYVMTRRGGSALEPLRVALGSRDEALVVFTSKRKARRYLGPGELGAGWRARESSAGELVSVLFGLCKGVGYVLLDPLPGSVGARDGGPALVEAGSFVGSCLRVEGG